MLMDFLFTTIMSSAAGGKNKRNRFFNETFPNEGHNFHIPSMFGFISLLLVQFNRQVSANEVTMVAPRPLVLSDLIGELIEGIVATP